MEVNVPLYNVHGLGGETCGLEADQDLGKEILGTELVHFEATGSMKKFGSSAMKSKPRTR